MKIFNKRLIDYFGDNWLFITSILALSVIQLIAVYLQWYAIKYVNPIGLLKLVVLGYAGWFASRKLNYTAKQTLVTGKILFLTSIIISVVLIQQFLPGIPLIYRIINFIIMLGVNLLIYIGVIELFWLIGSKLGKKKK